MNNVKHLLLFWVWLVLSAHSLQGQPDLFSQLSNAVNQDVNIEGYKNTLNFLQAQGCLQNEDIIVPYLETTVKDAPKQEIKINTVALNPDGDYITLVTNGDASPVADFYNSEKTSNTSHFTYIRMKKYIDSKLGLEANKKRGFHSLKSLIRAKNYQNVILIDDFGMSLPLVNGLKDYIKDLRSNVIIVPYSVAIKHFPEPSYYYTEIITTQKKKDVTKSYYKIQNKQQTNQNLAMVCLLPEGNIPAEQNHLKSVLYTYMQVSKQMPGVHITLYLLPKKDLAMMKQRFYRDLKNEQLLLGSIIFRNLNSLFPQRKLFAEGQHIRDMRKTLSGAQYSFQVNYTENDHSSDELLASSDELALILGAPNSDNTWHRYDQRTQDDLVRFLRTYIQSQITSHASSDRFQPNSRPGF